MRTITIVNLTRAQLVLNLPSGVVPEMSQPAPTRDRPAAPAVMRRAPGGRLVPASGVARATTRPSTRVSGAITLNAKGTPGASIKVPLAVRRAPEVQAALAARKIRIETVKEVVAPPAPPPTKRFAKPVPVVPGKDG